MMKFFRGIRQNSGASGNTNKYLKYALGEVLLVVFGILIAFQLNQWNDHRKKLHLENDYYCRLLDDIRLDKEQFINLSRLAEDRLVASNQCARLLLAGTTDMIEIGEQVTLATKAIYSDFRPNNSAYQDLKSGANLNIIRDKSVIKALNHYFNRVEELKSIIMINGQHAVDLLYAHEDHFVNGSALASIRSGRFYSGLDEDLKQPIQSLAAQQLSAPMRKRLLNESLDYISTNTRQIELYSTVLEEIKALHQLLERKCDGKQ